MDERFGGEAYLALVLASHRPPDGQVHAHRVHEAVASGQHAVRVDQATAAKRAVPSVYESRELKALGESLPYDETFLAPAASAKTSEISRGQSGRKRTPSWQGI